MRKVCVESKLHWINNNIYQLDIHHCSQVIYLVLLQTKVNLSHNSRLLMPIYFLTECSKHCSLCYNETECYECTQGYFMTEDAECQSKCYLNLKIKSKVHDGYCHYFVHLWKQEYFVEYILNVTLIPFPECPQHCSLCWNATECYECTHGYFLDENGLCESKLIIFCNGNDIKYLQYEWHWCVFLKEQL